MNKVASSMVVLLSTFIAASVAIMFVFGRTGMISGYSGEVQNSSVCEGLAQRADDSNSQAAQEYQQRGCAEIYGDIQYTNQVAQNTELMEGVTLNGWEQYAHYATRHEFDFTIDFQELDGKEYLSTIGSGFGNNGNFVYDENYNYKVDLYIRHPYENMNGNAGWHDKTSWIWNVDSNCDGATCHYKTNFTYSEANGNLSDTFLPCQKTSGSNHNLVQKLSVRAYNQNGDRVAWVKIQEHNMTMVDWSGTPCWKEKSLPSFENGKIVVTTFNASYPMNVNNEYRYQLTLKYDNESLSADELSVTAGIPNGQVSTSDSQYGERYEYNLAQKRGCDPWCSMYFNISVADGLDTPPCYAPNRDPSDISHKVVQLYLREKPSDDYHLLYEEMPIGNNQYGISPFCWQGMGSVGIGGIGGIGF